MNLSTRAVKALVANSSATGFTAKTAIAKGNGTPDAAPNSACIRVAAERGAGGVPDRVRLFPYGLGSDNDVFSLRLWGWYRIPGVSGENFQYWMPTILTEISCTISAFVGLAAGPVLNTERFADTLSLVALIGEYTYTAATTRNGTVELFTPANDTPACAEVPLRACEFIEFDWDQTTGTPSMNCLYQFIDENR